MRTIFTLGYQMRTIQEFVAILREESVGVLVDVRETAWSHKPGFSKRALEGALSRAGIGYVHARFAGNPKRLRAKASTHAKCLALYTAYLSRNEAILDDLERLVEGLIKAGKKVCLTCYERHPGDCHRGILADQWASRGRRGVKHLEPEGCPRLIGGFA